MYIGVRRDPRGLKPAALWIEFVEMPEKVAAEISNHADAQATHPLTVAARIGIGPLSERSKQVWHGQSAPCASCAQLNVRDAARCAHCGQDLSQGMLEKMAKHSGPWFVYDNIRPFPGVSLERMIRLIKREALKPTSIIRGPTTLYQWRFASETPLISKFLGRCWNCQAEVVLDEQYCPKCKAMLDGHYRADPAQPTTPGALAHNDRANSSSQELTELSKAIGESGVDRDLTQLTRKTEKPLGKAPLIFFAIAVVVVSLIVLLMSRKTEDDRSGVSRSTPAAEVSRLTDPSSYDIGMT